MTDLQNLQNYENWKSAKRKRKIWMHLISWISALFLAYLTIAIFSGAGIGNVWKTMKYSTTEFETKEQREQIPSDYLTWYKERKMDESWANKKFGHEPSYFTYEEIAKRKAKEKGEDWFGELGGKLLEWLASQGVPEDKKKEVDYIAYANDVYSSAWTVIFWGFIPIYLIYGLILRYIVLPLSWTEPKLTEQKLTQEV